MKPLRIVTGTLLLMAVYPLGCLAFALASITVWGEGSLLSVGMAMLVAAVAFAVFMLAAVVADV